MVQKYRALAREGGLVRAAATGVVVTLALLLGGCPAPWSRPEPQGNTPAVPQPPAPEPPVPSVPARESPLARHPIAGHAGARPARSRRHRWRVRDARSRVAHRAEQSAALGR